MCIYLCIYLQIEKDCKNMPHKPYIQYIFTIHFLVVVVVQSLSHVQPLQPQRLCRLPGCSVHGILQARVLEWVAISFSRGYFQLSYQTWVSCIAGRFFTTCFGVLLNSINEFPDSSVGKESTCNAEDPAQIPGFEKSAGKGIGYSLQYSWASLVSQLVKKLPTMWDTWV